MFTESSITVSGTVSSSDAVRDGVDGVRLHIVELESAVDILVDLSDHADVVAPDNVETQHDLE